VQFKLDFILRNYKKFLFLFFKGLVNSLDTLPDEKFIRGALLYDNEEVNIVF